MFYEEILSQKHDNSVKGRLIKFQKKTILFKIHHFELIFYL